MRYAYIDYALDADDTVNDSQYFMMDHSKRLSIEGPNRFQISQECLAMIYSKMKDEMHVHELTHRRDNSIRKRKRGYGMLSYTDWWKGELEMSKKLLVKQIVEKDVALSVMPPSFDSGCLAYERRKEKILLASKT